MVCWLKSYFRLGLFLSLLLLTGCLQYDLDLRFDSQTHGQWVQQLHWRGGTTVADPDLRHWLALLSDRARQIGGQADFTNDNTFEIAVPFNNGKELETKFNQFFQPAEQATPFTLPGGEPLSAEISLHQGNWLLAIYNHLQLRLDLTAVPDLTATGLPLLQGKNLLEGRVILEAPWVRSPTGETIPQQTWSLIPGEVNEIEANFWIPSPIGIGAVAIALLVLIGYTIKYGLMSRLSARHKA